jgi:hypothetical protein
LAVTLQIWLVSKSTRLLETTNSMEPTRFLNDPTSQTDIEECHRLRHRILLQDESIHNSNFQISEVKAPGTAIFALQTSIPLP